MKVLFLCEGNYSRSPAADAILKSFAIPNVESGSAGLTDWGAGKPPNLLLEKALAEVGVKPATHNPHLVTEAELLEARIIFVMESRHESIMRREHLAHYPKVKLLSELSGELADIPNPPHDDLEKLRKSTSTIFRHLSDGRDWLAELAARIDEGGLKGPR